MADHAKRRAPQHLIDKRGIALLKRVMPANWVLREYRPDYGLHYASEVFEDSGATYPQTLDEHFFIKLNSTYNPEIISLPLHRRGNVEKGKEVINEQPSLSLDT